MKSFEDMKAEMSAKWTGFTVKVKTKVRETYVWVSNNKEEAAVLIGIGSSLIGGAFKAAKMVNKKAVLKKEQDLKDLYVYDRSLGVYHELKHKLRPSEIQQIDRRKREGETLVQILTDMRLIK